MKAAVLLVLLGSFAAHAQLQQSGPCPQVPFMRKFNLTKLMGVWYEQIHTQRWSDLELECNTQMFTFKSNTSFTYDTFARNPMNKTSQYHRQGDVKLKLKNNTIVALDVSEGGEAYDVIVIDTDYKSFATLWTCMPAEASHYENIVVLTRDKFPGLSALLSALDALDAKNITRMYLVYTEQRNCPKFTFNTANTTTPKVESFTPVPPIDIVTLKPTSISDSNTASSSASNSDSPGASRTPTSAPSSTSTPSLSSNSPSTQSQSSSAPDIGSTGGSIITSSGTTQGPILGTTQKGSSLGSTEGAISTDVITTLSSSFSGMTTPADSKTSNPDSATTSHGFSDPGSATTSDGHGSTNQNDGTTSDGHGSTNQNEGTTSDGHGSTNQNTGTVDSHGSTTPGIGESTTQAPIKSTASSKYSVFSSIITSAVTTSGILLIEYLLSI